MAKTFDLNDPGQYQGYLKASLFQWLMYGENWLTLNEPDQIITVWDHDEVPPTRAAIR
jgi:hypothetical protein